VLPILTALNGHGPNATSLGPDWEGGGLGYKGVQYSIGPSPPELVLNLVNEQDYAIRPLWNVIGVINGTQQDEVVVLGNHRDAWIAGGAGDPSSGSAALNEVVRSFGAALAAGWQPRRTIVFASWDGEEYGLVGSTEWVEDHLPWLAGTAIAYLNVDVGTKGPVFDASASPLLNRAIYEATSRVPSPNQTIPGQTVRDLWSGRIDTLGSGSDYTAFQEFAGIPSVSFGFGNGPGSTVYHYHSNYDSFAWMDAFGDKGWHHHVAITQVWALLAAHLVEDPVIPFSAADYAKGMAAYLQHAIDKARESPHAEIRRHAFRDLEAAIADLLSRAAVFDGEAGALAEQVAEDIPWWNWWKKAKLSALMKVVNTKYKYLERQFLYAPGLDGRTWFKHVVFAPGWALLLH
jgi:N-acetylated-alpha-linked acidic dipeptidase